MHVTAFTELGVLLFMGCRWRDSNKGVQIKGADKDIPARGSGEDAPFFLSLLH